MSKTIWILIGAVIVVGLAAWGFSASLKPADSNRMMGDSVSGKAMTANKENAMMKEKAAKSEKAMKQQSGSYKDYSAATVASEQAAGNKVVLFFRASWCPTCKAADAAFRANASDIPAGVTVLETDYDSEKGLKAKYAVTTQHTFVQIDNNGNQVSKWVSGDIAMLKTNLK